jgi:hypothetical protein
MQLKQAIAVRDGKAEKGKRVIGKRAIVILADSNNGKWSKGVLLSTREGTSAGIPCGLGFLQTGRHRSQDRCVVKPGNGQNNEENRPERLIGDLNILADPIPIARY